MSATSLKALARYTDSLSFIYLEHAVLEKEEQSVAAFTATGRINLPAATLGTVLLGPGTRITHAAMQVLAACGCVVCWVGEDGLRSYACGQARTRSSAAIERQCAAWADPSRRMQVVRHLYEMRFRDPVSPDLTLQQIRGMEGARVRDAYRELAQRHGVTWNGRQYKSADWDATDPVNRALSAANAALYAVVLSGLHSLGYSPALGFIHTGKQLSFVYDVADLFKTSTTVPAAFEAAATSAQSPEARARERFRQLAEESHLLDNVVRALRALFPDARETGSEPSEMDVDDATPGPLWDPDHPVPGGVLHGGPDT